MATGGNQQETNNFGQKYLYQFHCKALPIDNNLIFWGRQSQLSGVLVELASLAVNKYLKLVSARISKAVSNTNQ